MAYGKDPSSTPSDIIFLEKLYHRRSFSSVVQNHQFGNLVALLSRYYCAVSVLFCRIALGWFPLLKKIFDDFLESMLCKTGFRHLASTLGHHVCF